MYSPLKDINLLVRHENMAPYGYTNCKQQITRCVTNSEHRVTHRCRIRSEAFAREKEGEKWVVGSTQIEV